MAQGLTPLSSPPYGDTVSMAVKYLLFFDDFPECSDRSFISI